MAKKPKRTASWMEVAVRHAGLRKGSTGMVWAFEWAVVREATGHEPTVEEVAEQWGLNRRTAFREQAAFREAFPMLETPAQIYADPEVRAVLKSLADLGSDTDEADTKQRRPSQDLGAIRIGTLPATL